MKKETWERYKDRGTVDFNGFVDGIKDEFRAAKDAAGKPRLGLVPPSIEETE